VTVAGCVQGENVVVDVGACAIEEVDEFIRIAFETEVVELELFAAVAEENGDQSYFRWSRSR